jgi:hypothetical protein
MRSLCISQLSIIMPSHPPTSCFQVSPWLIITLLTLPLLLTFLLPSVISPSPGPSFPSPLSSNSFQERCLAFKLSEFVTNSTLIHLEYIPANTTLTSLDSDVSCARPTQLVETKLCRVALRVATSERSSVDVEVWFPDPAAWTGRLATVGNGGLDGCMPFPPFHLKSVCNLGIGH